MNQHLQSILDTIQKDVRLSIDEKSSLSKSLKDADKELEITAFELDRTEKLKRSTAILLEETIEELEQKRKAIEEQNKELEIETALETVRTVAMSMSKPDDMLHVCRMISDQLHKLGFKEIRNVQTVIFYQQKHEYLNYQYFTPYDKTSIEVIDYQLHPDVLQFTEKMLESADAYYTKTFEGDELNVWRQYRKETNQLPDPKLDETSSTHYYFYSIGSGALGVTTYAALTENQINLFKRFRNVFDLAYRRFIDIQKAEAQAREAQIQLALERVRARTMAMQKSDELSETVYILFQQFKDLGEDPIQITIGIFNQEEKLIRLNITGLDGSGSRIDQSFDMDIDEPSLLHKLYIAWKEEKKSIVLELAGKELFAWITYRNIVAEKYNMASTTINLDDRRFVSAGFFSMGFISFSKSESIPHQTMQILERFASVFQQTYTRFLDLQKAEAQAREATIETALERVRSRSMAMHSSNELKEVITVVIEQFKHLGFNLDLANFNYINNTTHWNMWLATPDAAYPEIIHLPYIKHPLFDNPIKAVKKGLDFMSDTLTKEEKNSAMLHFYTNTILNEYDTEERKKYVTEGKGLARSIVFMKHIILTISNFNAIPYTDEQNIILKRFANVFEQSYTRFLDLQKAEAQAREAQVELALERVRARTMSMQHSDELAEAATLVFQQFSSLGLLPESSRVFFSLIDEDTMTSEVWTTKEDGILRPGSHRISLKANKHLTDVYESWKGKRSIYNRELIGSELTDYLKYITSIPYLKEDKALQQLVITPPDHLVFTEAFFAQGTIGVIGVIPLTDESQNTLTRFSKVFEQTYTRFLDLQKAETQAREAKIEAAMEKVRSRALAMQKPDELVAVAQLLRREMDLLGVEELETSSIYIHHEETGRTECWYAIKDITQPEKELVSDHMDIDLSETEVGRQMIEFYRSDKKQISIPMQGDARKEWINYCADHSKVLNGFYGDTIPDRTYHLYKFSNGYMGAASPGDISTESWDWLQRATSVFSFAYTRFSDLQKAQAQAKEAQIEAALERVRSRTMAMQKSEELAETAAVLFKQLIFLGIEPNRLYINIIKNESGDAEFWITDEDGSKVSSAFETNLNKNPTFKKMLNGWKQQKGSVTIDMQGKELQEYFDYLNSIHVPFKGGLTQKRRLQYIAYFSKGFIGMASPDEQPDGTMLLLERFAAVFNLTFTRFNDLQLAEAHAVQAEQDLIEIKAARKKAEDALSELQVTQTQLIQSEKMASLGELTAGIAHEIQNPLNFVNNFSEVSNELISEMVEEVDKGNTEEIKALAKDVQQNLEKILHHGKRADAIVKGMLQHSRSSNGKKEPTDINALADEYLRLAYHGLRAKDKSFNAKFETDFDNNIGNINIIPQDIGRVILNLITNAFYAVSEKTKTAGEDYQATVWVQTKKVNDKIQIAVKDNGNGIPQKVSDKIFQPFFTTKPTGEGTGLGLSLSYDIIKAHGGELKAETKEGEFAKFIIILPNN